MGTTDERGIFNRRGVVQKEYYEGGEQDRKIAITYAAFAEACNVVWPGTAAVLNRVAETYGRMADQEDEEAKLRR